MMFISTYVSYCFTALYGTLNIWYAGIVAEMSCPGNKNRLLVFFDDGFAQYLSIKKVHKVHHKGKKKYEFEMKNKESMGILVGSRGWDLHKIANALMKVLRGFKMHYNTAK